MILTFQTKLTSTYNKYKSKITKVKIIFNNKKKECIFFEFFFFYHFVIIGLNGIVESHVIIERNVGSIDFG